MGPKKNIIKSSRQGTPKAKTDSNLSQNCDSMPWKFHAYVGSTGSQEVQKKIDGQGSSVVLPFMTRLRYLANTKKSDWHEPHAKKLSGVQEIYEIRFKAAKKQYRPLGFFGPQLGQFTILIWANHKQNIYDPAEAITTAEERRKKILSGAANCVPLKIDGEDFSPPKG